MENVRNHKVVSVTYMIEDDTGNVVERSDLPISYVHGGNSGLFEKIEQALEGREVGDTVQVTLDPDEGFGPHDPDLTFTDDIANVPPEFRHVGAEVEMQNAQGESRIFQVSDISDGKLTVDANHPLAGKTVTFTVTVAAIRDATPDELVNGIAPMPSVH